MLRRKQPQGSNEQPQGVNNIQSYNGDRKGYTFRQTGKAKIIYSNGDTYEGDVINGQKNGSGTYTFANGKTLCCLWKDDKYDTDEHICEFKVTNDTETTTYHTSNQNKLGQGAEGIAYKCSINDCQQYVIKYVNTNFYNRHFTLNGQDNSTKFNREIEENIKMLNKLKNSDDTCNKYILCPIDYGIYESDCKVDNGQDNYDITQTNKGKYVIIYEYLQGYTELYDYWKKKLMNFPKKQLDSHNTWKTQQQHMNTFKTIEINNQTILSEEIKATTINNLIDGLKYIHSKNIIHKDIKPENIMFNPNNGSIKYIDFGFACVPDKCNSHDGTPNYMVIFNKPNGMANNKYFMDMDLYALLLTISDIFYNGMDIRKENQNMILGPYKLQYGEQVENFDEQIQTEIYEKIQKKKKEQIINLCNILNNKYSIKYKFEVDEDRYNNEKYLYIDYSLKQQ